MKSDIIKRFGVTGKTIAQVAEALEVTPKYVRTVVGEAVKDGRLIAVGTLKTGKRGRPATLYSNQV